MKLRDILGVLNTPCVISIEKTLINCKVPEDRFICLTKSDSEGVLPYLDRDLVVWGLTNPIEQNTPAELYFRIAEAGGETVHFCNGDTIVETLQQEED